MKKFKEHFMQKQSFILFLAILVSFSWAKEKQEVEIPINIGVGPAFFWIPGVVGRELHPGAKFDLYGVITPKILQEHKDKIPQKYRKYVNMENEMHITPIWLSLIPNYIIISPGEESSVYGGLWSFIGLSINLVKNELMELECGAVLPTITYIYASDSKKNDPAGQHLLGIGAMLRLANTIKFSESFLTTLAYGHNFNVPLKTLESPIQTNVYKEKAGKDDAGKNKTERKEWIQAGALSLVFHFRFNITQKI
jgi:hypothetical protein